MKTKELIDYIKNLPQILEEDDNLKAGLREEIVQKLLEHNELRKLAYDAVTPLIELFNFLIAISEDYQTGDINYGR